MIVSIVAFLLGAAASYWLANRWIDHRWYCGRRHRASHPCRPTPENLERWRRTEEHIDRAEELEYEAKRLRRSG